MKKFAPYIGIALIILLVVVATFPDVAHAFNAETYISKAIAWIFNTILMPVAGTILYLAGTLLNISIDQSLRISTIVDNVNSIEIAWKTIRDLVSMFFIFIILYISIRTILGFEDKTKKLIINLVIAGLLINFSLFFSKVIIDASNVLAYGFYNAMPTNGERVSNTARAPWNYGISGLFMQQLKIQSNFKPYNPANPSQVKVVESGKAKFLDTIIQGIMGVVLTLVAAFIFFAAAILFMIRIAMLIFLMALSPIAFVGMILPATKKYSDKWWDYLLKQSFFAPIYLGLTYIAVKIVSDPAFSQRLGVSAEDSFAAGVAKSGALFLNYVIVIIFFVAALLSAQEFGAVGASTLSGWGKDLRKWGAGKLGQQSLGRLARSVSNSERFKNFATRNPNLATFAAGGLKTVSGASFGGTKGGYDKSFDTYSKNRQELAKKLGSSKDVVNARVREYEQKLNSEKDKYNRALALATDPKSSAMVAGRSKKIAEEAQKRIAEMEKTNVEEIRKKAENERKEEFAKNLEGGFNPFTKKARQNAAEAIRREMKKSKKDKAWDDLQNALKEDGGGGEKKEEKKK
jgi:hypothetical protein